jgi:hypothetical protein
MRMSFGAKAALPVVVAMSFVACAPAIDVGVTPPVERLPTDPVVIATVNAVPAGTELTFTLDQTIGTGVSQVGDHFYATLQTPVLGPDRQTLIPRGARISGTITGLRTAIDAATPAVVRLDFHHLYVGQQAAEINAEVIGTEARLEGRTVDHALRGAVTGAAAGAVLGAVVGRDMNTAIRGAALGAGVGTVISLGTADREAVLQEGTHLQVRLLDPMRVPGRTANQ